MKFNRRDSGYSSPARNVRVLVNCEQGSGDGIKLTPRHSEATVLRGQQEVQVLLSDFLKP
jgi:hypothetical protein